MTALSHPDVVVVGAGVVGAACADALAERGMSVLVLDSGFPGSGTTSAAMGHVVVMDDSEAQFALTAYGRRLWTDSSAELPDSLEHEATGTVWVAADDEELEHASARARFYERRGVEAELLDAPALERLEPNLRPGLAGGLLVPGDCVLYPPAAVERLVERACARGADLRLGVRVVEIDTRGVRTEDGWIEAGDVVVAAGAATVRLVPELPIEPRKGHLMVTDRAPGLCRHQLVELGYLKSAHSAAAESVAFNVQPRSTGQVLVGSSREFVGFDSSLNRRLCSEMARRAISYLPALSETAVLRTWVGFRPCTTDNLPFIGPWPLLDGVWVAAGHEGLGITTAPATARVLVDLMCGRAPEIDPAPYAPERALRGGRDAAEH